MFKFTFQTDAKISTIKAFRTASQIPLGGDQCWSLKFTKDMVEHGIIIQTSEEAFLFLHILVLAKKAIKEDNCFVGGARVDFGWTVEEYKAVAQPVFFCNRN